MTETEFPFSDQQLLQAMLYVTGELDDRSCISFEKEMQNDVVLCEAVAEATRLSLLLVQGRGDSTVATKAVLHRSAETPSSAQRRKTRLAWLAPAAAAGLLLAAVVFVSNSRDDRVEPSVAEQTGDPSDSESFEYAEQLADLWSSPVPSVSPDSQSWSDEPRFADDSSLDTVASVPEAETDWIMFALLPDEDLSPVDETDSEDDDEIIDDDIDEATL